MNTSCGNFLAIRFCQSIVRFVHWTHLNLSDAPQGNIVVTYMAWLFCCIRNIIYSIEFSPNGEFLASGSLDNWLYVWSMKDGRLIKSYYGGGGVSDISWNKSSDKIAVTYVNKLVTVLDLKM